MSELASNNPFRDRTSTSTQPSQVRPGISTSKNPFVDSASMHQNAQEDTSRRLRKQREDVVARTGTSDLGPEIGRHSRREPHSSDKTNKSLERPSSKRSVRPLNSSGSVSSSSRPHRPRSVSETSAAELKKERATAASMRQQPGKEKSKTRKHLDKIDLLDVTGFATAGGFHHDGPFDACNPSRNKNVKKAPVLAFAKDSSAMTMAAGPPVQPVYFGDHINNPESFSDFGGSSVKTRPDAGLRTASFDPASHTDPIHGYESVGLGTSTFLEGAPASRSAMLARTVSDNGSKQESRPRATSEYASGAGLGRKKSVLQKIRGAYRDRAAEVSEPVIQSPPESSFKQKEETSSYFLEVAEPSDTKGALATTSGQISQSASRLSPLYRPASSEEEMGVQGTGTSSLIKRVKSLRVTGKKRGE